jgi:hypothetical protein
MANTALRRARRQAKEEVAKRDLMPAGPERQRQAGRAAAAARAFRRMKRGVRTEGDEDA